MAVTLSNPGQQYGAGDTGTIGDSSVPYVVLTLTQLDAFAFSFDPGGDPALYLVSDKTATYPASSAIRLYGSLGAYGGPGVDGCYTVLSASFSSPYTKLSVAALQGSGYGQFGFITFGIVATVQVGTPDTDLAPGTDIATTAGGLTVPITDVDIATNQFKVAGDYTAILASVGYDPLADDVYPLFVPFTVSGSTGNNDTAYSFGSVYGVADPSFSAGKTTIPVYNISGKPNDATADGNIVIGAEGCGHGLTFDKLGIATAFTPTVDAGANQTVIGPPPVAASLSATFTAGSNTVGSPSYAWTQTAGPVDASIESPTAANTDVTFDAYAPGTYTFTVTATILDINGVTFAPSDTVSVVIQFTQAPRVSSATHQVTYPAGLTMSPTIQDDGWGGSLTYAWAQIVGPSTATIVSPSSASSVFSFPDVPGVYVFSLTAERGDGSPPLSGVGFQRVTVYTADLPPDQWNDTDVTVLANSVEKTGLVESCRITKRYGEPSDCSFRMYGESIDCGNDVTITRGGVRLFGGVCLTRVINRDEAGHIFYDIKLTGYAWHLTRERVTHTYANMSISDVATALVDLAPGNLTTGGIAGGLPSVDMVFDDAVLLDALNQLAQLVTPQAHVYVDDFKSVHFTAVESGTGPTPLAANHPSLRNVALTEGLAPVVNRLTLKYDSVIVLEVLVDGELEVDSLDGYSSDGGVTEIDSDTYSYTGTDTRLAVPVVYGGNVQPGLLIEAIAESDGAFTYNQTFGYALTICTDLGETPVQASWGGLMLTDIAHGGGVDETAVRITVLSTAGLAAAVARVTKFNVYRTSNEDGDSTPFLVGSIFPGLGSVFVDKVAKANVDTVDTHPPIVDTADGTAYFLTGVDGERRKHTPASISVNDAAAQASLATRLGGGDSGVIATTLTAGSMSDADARGVANNALAQLKDLRRSLYCEVRDDLAVPGQTLSYNLPAPLGSGDLKIQETEVVGFTHGVPHYHNVTAAPDTVRMTSVLQSVGTS